MKIHKPDTSALLYRTLRFENRDLLSIAVIAMFPFERSGVGALASESDLWKVTAQALGPDSILDVAFPKPRGEWLAYGTAYAPAGEPAPLLATTIELGAARKELYVFGDRYFNALGGISSPEPFERMPIEPARAYGGANVVANPAGRGGDAVPSPSGAMRQPLPNIESPAALIAEPRDVRTPSGYWAWPAAIPERTGLLGAFDQAWLSNQWPHLPNGTHTDYFCSAPPDQRIEGFWRGDESIAIRNMNLTKPMLRGHLPGLRARCFVNRRAGDATRFEECVARAETVWLFPEIEQGVVLYRAVAPIGDEDADDIAHIMVDWEPLSTEPLSVETYRDRLLETITPSAPVKTLEPSDAIPAEVAPAQPPVAQAAAPVAAPPVAPVVIPGMEELEKLTAEIEMQTQSLMKQHGLTQKDIEALMPPEVPSPAQPVAAIEQDIASLMQSLERTTADLLKQHNLTPQDVEKMTASLDAQQQAANAPMDLRALGEQMRAMHAQTQQMIAGSGKTIDELAAQVADPELAAALRESATFDIDAMVAGLESMAAVLPAVPIPGLASAAPAAAPEPEGPAAPAVEARLTREDVLAFAASGRSMAGLDLSGLDLSDASLEGTDFNHALLAETRFTGSRLSRANLSGSMLSKADFSGADLRGASLAGASAGSAVFKSAQLDGASLEAGDFAAADFSEASLVASNCANAVFTGSKMAGLRAAGCAASRASFDGCTLSGADFSDAQLKDAVFDNAALDGATFSRANCEKLRLFATRAAGVRFDQANLTGSRSGLFADLSGATFTDARLDAATWLDVDIRKSVFDGSSLERANFSGAQAGGARFVRVQAKSMRLAKADLSDADLSHSNFMNATLRRARLDGALLQYSNLYGAQCYGSTIGKASLEGANIDRTLLMIPGRAEAQR